MPKATVYQKRKRGRWGQPGASHSHKLWESMFRENSELLSFCLLKKKKSNFGNQWLLDVIQTQRIELWQGNDYSTRKCQKTKTWGKGRKLQTAHQKPGKPENFENAEFHRQLSSHPLCVQLEGSSKLTDSMANFKLYSSKSIPPTFFFMLNNGNSCLRKLHPLLQLPTFMIPPFWCLDSSPIPLAVQQQVAMTLLPKHTHILTFLHDLHHFGA